MDKEQPTRQEIEQRLRQADRGNSTMSVAEYVANYSRTRAEGARKAAAEATSEDTRRYFEDYAKTDEAYAAKVEAEADARLAAEAERLAAIDNLESEARVRDAEGRPSDAYWLAVAALSRRALPLDDPDEAAESLDRTAAAVAETELGDARPFRLAAKAARDQARKALDDQTARLAGRTQPPPQPRHA